MAAHECLATKDVRDALLHAITLLELRRDALLGYADQIADTPPGALIVEGAGQAELSAAVLRRLVEPAVRST
jgi:hypothetical protein